MKNILITGATSGIGKEIASLLSKDNDIFLTGRRKLDKVNYYPCDLVDMFEIETLYNKAVEYFNSDIDILINCAGQYCYKPIENMTFDEISYLLDVNFKSAYILSSLVVLGMKKNKWGRIINIGSISGVIGEANASLYSLTKSAFLGLTKSLALELAADGITVNTINPGWVDTNMGQESVQDSDFTIEETIETIPQRRFIEPDEIASLVKYLISEDAKGLTGQAISLCAGLSCG